MRNLRDEFNIWPPLIILSSVTKSRTTNGVMLVVENGQRMCVRWQGLFLGTGSLMQDANFWHLVKKRAHMKTSLL